MIKFILLLPFKIIRLLFKPMLFIFGFNKTKKHILNSQPFINPPPGYQIIGLKNISGNRWKLKYKTPTGMNSETEISPGTVSFSVGADTFSISWND